MGGLLVYGISMKWDAWNMFFVGAQSAFCSSVRVEIAGDEGSWGM